MTDRLDALYAAGMKYITIWTGIEATQMEAVAVAMRSRLLGDAGAGPSTSRREAVGQDVAEIGRSGRHV
jgi:hypothetical protein